MQCRMISIQWNLAIPATLGPTKVAGLTKVFNVEDGLLNQSVSERLAIIAKWLQFIGLK